MHVCKSVIYGLFESLLTIDKDMLGKVAFARSRLRVPVDSFNNIGCFSVVKLSVK